MLLDPQGNPLPDNLWTQFVAFQATLIKRLDQAIAGLGVPQSFGFAVASYTLLIRTMLYPFVKARWSFQRGFFCRVRSADRKVRRRKASLHWWEGGPNTSLDSTNRSVPVDAKGFKA